MLGFLVFFAENSWMEPRKCDYNGRYYCPFCHKNNTLSIPARILHNWDFEEKKVSEATRQFLTLMAKKPNINLDKSNPKLFTFVEDLNIVKVKLYCVF
jgi:cupin superfamily acireductone dioxygenase involved in methionine salvage